MAKAKNFFYMNPPAFAKKLFTAAKSDWLDISQEEPEDHLTYSYPPEGSPATTNGWYSIIRRARNPIQVRRAPAVWGPMIYSESPWLQCTWLNGISVKLYKNGPTDLEQLVVCLSSTKSLAERIHHKRMVPGWWVWIFNEWKSTRVGSFGPTLKARFLWGNCRANDIIPPPQHYINTSVQKAGIPGFPGCLEPIQMTCNSLTIKRKKKQLQLTWPKPMDLCLTVAPSLHWSSSTTRRRCLISLCSTSGMSSCVSPPPTVQQAGKHGRSASWWAALSHLCCLSCVWS